MTFLSIFYFGSNFTPENKNPTTMFTFNDVPAATAEILERLEGVENKLEKIISNSSTLNPDEYITRKEAAAILHITLPTLLKLSVSGKIKGYRIGSRILYKRKEINAATTPMLTSKMAS
jgi:excisionase family DNA binding protein